MVEIRLLGPLEVVAGDERLVVPGRRERALLGRLALSENRLVPTESLVRDLWGDDAPADPLGALQVHVSRLRKSLQAAGDGGMVVTRAGGYMLAVPGDAVDAACFARLVSAGRRLAAGGYHRGAADRLSEALGLWRGPALADLGDAAFVARESARLEEERFTALEDRLEAELACGRHRDLLAELTGLTQQHPLRERLWGQRMLALYRSGRQAEALRVYQDLRRILGEELGLEPGAALRRLELAILHQEPALDAPSSTAITAHGGRAAVPIALPLFMTGGRVFVGRQAELDRLLAVWEEASAGGLRLMLVGGEPGVGKTRLAAEMAHSLHARGAVVLAGRCDEDLGVPYQPFVEALRHFVDHASGSGRLAAGLGRYGGELVRLVPELAERAPELPPPLRSDPETERYRLFDAVAAWLGELSRAVPVLLVLDDLQWATKPTLLMLRHLIRSAEPTRMLAVGTYRDTELDRRHPLAAFLADLHHHDGTERLVLHGLDEDGVAEYLMAAAGHDVDAEGRQLAHAVWSQTEGNPFFVGEVLRHLTEIGAVAQLDERWVTTSAMKLGIPEGVREVIGRRLSRLSEQTNRVLALAAVLGPEFDLAVLGQLAGMDEEALVPVLGEAVAARLVVEVAESWSPRDRFAHALVRATLYDELPLARRVALHRRAGEAIEAIHGDHLDDHLPALSHHFAQACAGGNVTKAVDYAARAGERASVLLAHDEAVTYYRSALDLLEAAGASADDARRLPLLCALGKAQQRAGNPAHRETLLTAARLAGQHGDADTLTQAALANTRGHLPTQIGLVDNERVAMLEAAVTAIGDRGPASRARLLGTLGLELIFAGDWRRCLALSDEALALARDLGDPNTLARVLHTRHLPTSLPGFLAERLANTAELLNLVEVVGDPTLATDAYVLRCRAALEAGDVAEADKYLEAADRQARELNQPSLRFRVLYVRVGRLVVAGRFAEAETLLKEVAQLGQATGQGDAELMTAGQTFCIRRHTGRLDHETVTFLEQARPPSPVPMIDAMLAVIACELGQEDAARHALTSVTSSLPSFDIYWLSTMANWAWIASRLGETDSAEALHTLLAPYGEHHVPFLPWPSPSVAHHLGLLATTLRRFEEAEQQLAAANEIHERLGARHWVAETGLAEAEMRQARRGPGDTERARTLIDQALATATGLGASAIERWAAKLR